MYNLKSFFICNFWSWSNVFSGDRDRSLLDFLTWMGLVGFPELFGSVLGLCPFSIPLVYFWAALSYFFVINTCCFLPIKKKKIPKMEIPSSSPLEYHILGSKIDTQIM